MGRPYNDPVREWRREWIEYNLDQKLQRDLSKEREENRKREKEKADEIWKNMSDKERKAFMIVYIILGLLIGGALIYFFAIM